MKRVPLSVLVVYGVVVLTASFAGCESDPPGVEGQQTSEVARSADSIGFPKTSVGDERREVSDPTIRQLLPGGTVVEKVTEPTATSPDGTIATDSSPAGDAPAPVRRWAIISSESMRTGGFPDLVTSVLDDVEGIELVERDQLDLVLAELELSELQSPGGGEDRQRLGVLAGAQRLLLLDGKDWNGSGDVGVQVIDTYSGVNLFRGQVKLEKDSADAAAERMATLARDLEQKYADGIRAVVGIPYFLSKTANKGNASLQEEFPNLLASAVRNLPGVAVLAVKEAQLIQNEMVLSGHSIRRFLPLFVSGEYEIYARQADNDQRLRLSVTVSDGSEVEKKIEKDRITLPEARELLTSEAAELILELLSRKDLLPLTREQQEAALVARADELVKAGEILKAIELREAALLISPNNPRHRVQIVLDRSDAGGKFCDYEAVRPHVEYLLRNRIVGTLHGIALLQTVGPWASSSGGRAGSETNHSPGERQGVPEYATERDFQFAMFPLLLRLPAGDGSGRGLREVPEYRAPSGSEEHETAVHSYAGTPLLKPYSMRARAEVAQMVDDLCFVLESLPQDALPADPGGIASSYGKLPSQQELAKTCDRLRQSGKLRDKFFADFFHFAVRMECHPDAMTDEAFSELNRLREKLRELEVLPNGRLNRFCVQEYEKWLTRWEGTLVDRFPEPVKTSTYQGLRNPLPAMAERSGGVSAGPSIEPIDDWPIPSGKEVRGQPRRYPHHLIQLDQTTDVVWTCSAVHLMTRSQEGAVQQRRIYEIGRDEEAIFLVRTDGAHIWLANVAGQILVFSREGAKVAEFEGGKDVPSFESTPSTYGEDRKKTHPQGESLPHFRSSHVWQAQSQESARHKWLKLALFPIAPNKCLACGRMGDLPETWIALLSIDVASGKPNAEVLHCAGRLYPVANEAGLSLPENTDICFSVPWICLWQNPIDPQDRVAIVGRSHDCCSDTYYLPNMPLAVDLRTKKVITLAERLPGLSALRSGVSAVCVDGSLVVVDATSTIVWHWQPDGSFERVDVAEGPTQDYFLLPVGNCVYSVGKKWLAIELGSEVVVTTFAEDAVSNHDAFDRYATSATYGLWAEGTRSLIPSRIESGNSSHEPLSSFAEFVPPDRLKIHDAAVYAIRKLGGFVGMAEDCRTPYYLGLDGSVKKNGTAVCLTDRWDGGDDGLRYLRDLYRLKIVFLLNADITERGFQEITGIDSITALALGRMPLTDKTFQSLAALPQLQALLIDLGPTGDGGIGEECVALLQTSTGLESVALLGPAFTDGCLDSLRRMKRLNWLSLSGTAISIESTKAREGQSVLHRLREKNDQ